MGDRGDTLRLYRGRSWEIVEIHQGYISRKVVGDHGDSSRLTPLGLQLLIEALCGSVQCNCKRGKRGHAG